MNLNIKSSRNLLIAGFSLFTLLPLHSCKKILDAEAYSSFTSDNFFADVNEANMATLGVYEVMSAVDVYGWNLPMVFDTDTDIGQISGDTGDAWRVIPHYKAMPETNVYYTVWSAFYTGINRANTVIESIQQMDQFKSGSQDQKAQLNRFLGEAKFLRAFYYSELVRLWGDVPFKNSSSKAGDNLTVGLTDRYEIYGQVIKDMQEAAELLPAAMPTNERINKWACKAMLARVALFAGGYSLNAEGSMKRPDKYKEYYSLAQQQINEVIGANVYKLNPDYIQVFKNQCLHKLEFTENIFEVAFSNPSGTRGNGSWIGFWNAATTAKGVFQPTNPRYIVMRPFYDLFQDNDQRKDFVVAKYNINAAGARTYLTGNNEANWAVGKWSREYQSNDALEASFTYINHVVMRYSDLLLMRAEVENELNGGPNEIAIDAINQVRRRAYGLDNTNNGLSLTIVNGGAGYTANPIVTISGGGGNFAAARITARNTGTNSLKTLVVDNVGQGYTAVPTVSITGGGGSGAVVTAALLPKATIAQIAAKPGLNQAAFLDLIIDERAKELCFEGMRRADLIRWNKLSSAIAETNTKVKAIRANYPYPAFDNFVPGKHELYPFPQNETDVNKAITRQNPGF